MPFPYASAPVAAPPVAGPVETRRLVSLTAAAEYIGCSRRTLRRRIEDGTQPALRFGSRDIKVSLDDVDALLRPVAPRSGGEVG